MSQAVNRRKSSAAVKVASSGLKAEKVSKRGKMAPTHKKRMNHQAT